MSSRNHKLYQDDPHTPVIGCFRPRVYDKKAKGKHAAHLVVKCGCCDEEVAIYPPNDEADNTIEIGGVSASREEWRMILLPMLSDKDNPIAVLRKGNWKEYK
jgi:hypothetical protein